MAVMASASIVVTYRAEAQNVTTFWRAQPSTAATPAAPTTTSTDAYVADWSTAMPAYDSALRCYRVERVERSDGTCSWGEVTEDQGWRGANAANSTATNASQTAKATNAKIEKLEDSIVSTVNGELTYTAPDGSTQTNELATKVKQTDTSLTATISRTDALETMVHEYSGGVLVSKIKNGATVNGALVNADGSFDVVNVTWNSGTPTVGKKLMRLAKNSIEFNNPDTSFNICNITANGTLTNIDVPNGSLAIDEMPAWCQALGDSGYDSFIAGKMLQLGAGNRTTYSEILIEPDGTTIDGYKFALGTNNTTDRWVPVMGGHRNAGYLVHRDINLKWGPNAYAVYGAYNPNGGGDHYYTTNVNEYNKLVKSGWTGSGVYFYAAL